MLFLGWSKGMRPGGYRNDCGAKTLCFSQTKKCSRLFFFIFLYFSYFSVTTALQVMQLDAT